MSTLVICPPTPGGLDPDRFTADFIRVASWRRVGPRIELLNAEGAVFGTFDAP